MIFQHSYTKVLDGSKTQTRRIVKPDQHYAGALHHFIPWVYRGTGRYAIKVWETGKTYAVQPSRNEKAVGRIFLKKIRLEDVRNISLEDAKAEGFTGYGFDPCVDFLLLWMEMHDPKALPVPMDCICFETADIRYGALVDYLNERPAERYQAWVLEFAKV